MADLITQQVIASVPYCAPKNHGCGIPPIDLLTYFRQFPESQK